MWQTAHHTRGILVCGDSGDCMNLKVAAAAVEVRPVQRIRQSNKLQYGLVCKVDAMPQGFLGRVIWTHAEARETKYSARVGVWT